MLITICKQSYANNLSNDILWEYLYPYHVIIVRQAHLVDTDTDSGPVEDLREKEVPQPLLVVPSPVPSSDDLHLTIRQAHTPATVDTESEPDEAPSKTEEFEASEPSDTRITSSHSSDSSDSIVLGLYPMSAGFTPKLPHLSCDNPLLPRRTVFWQTEPKKSFLFRKYAAHTIYAPVFLKTQKVRRTYTKYAALSAEFSPAESDLKPKPKPKKTPKFLVSELVLDNHYETAVRSRSRDIGSLIGKRLELADALERHRVDIACFQETKWKGSSNIEGNGYKLWYSGSPTARNGVRVILKVYMKDKVVYVIRCSDRIKTLMLVIDGETVNVISVYAPQVGLSEVEKKTFRDSLDKVMREFPTDKRLILGGGLNGHIGVATEGYAGVHRGFGYGVINEEGRAILDFAIAHDLVVVNSNFKKRDHHLVTFQSGGRREGSALLRILWKNLSRDATKAFRSRVAEGVSTQVEALVACDVNSMWNALASIIKDAAKDALGVQGAPLVREGNEDERLRVQERYKEAKRQAKKVIAQAKEKAYEHLYKKLDSKEGANDIFRIVKAQERRRRDLGEICFIKDEEGRTIIDEEEIKKRWGEYFSSLFNAMEREGHKDGVGPSRQPHPECYYSRINQAKVRTALRKMGRNKAVGPDQIPIEAWRSLGDEGIFWLTSLFNKIFTSVKMPEEWRLNEVIPILKNKDDAQVYSNYRGIKLLSHTMKLWERVIERRLRRETSVSENQIRGRFKHQIENWREALEGNGLRVSREKTEYLRCDFDNGEIAHNKEVDVCIKDKILQPKESFRYLRSMLHKSGRIDEDVSNRIKVAWMKWRAATGVLCDRNVPLKLKGKFYRVAIRLAMLYGSECWPIMKALANRVEVAELRMLRWTCDERRTAEMVRTCQEKTKSSPVRRVETLVVDGLRRRGRPKLRWEDRVKHDMKELLLFEDMTSDRKEWRARIRLGFLLLSSFACVDACVLPCFVLIILLCALWDFFSIALCMASRLCRMVAFRVCLLVLALPAPVLVCLLCAFVLCIVDFA
ncbi:retrovirus-related pol polyprotein LINE-1 [Tanacetum coccineum]